jgi:MFS family permease
MAEQLGYRALLRHNRAFRLLWYGQVASQLGDWLDAIALYALLLRLTGSGAALAGLLVAQYLPSVLVGLGAGVVVDRLPRKAVLIAADLGRAALVLLFLLVRAPGQVWLVYAVSALKFTLTSFFEPAREAVIPDVVARAELVAANGISSLTWSVMLTGGAALGGLVAGTLGTDLAFVLDALSFLLSAAFTRGVPVRETHLKGRPPAHPLQELREGLGYLLAHRDVAVYASSKALWSLGGGGVLVLLPLFGKRVFPLGQDGALGMGVLYAARGIGAGLGPLLAQRWGGGSVRSLRRSLGPGFLLMGLGYLLLGAAPGLPAAAGALVLAHFGGSIQWVFSTALLQLEVPNRLQGRVFALEMALLTLVLCVSSYAAGLGADAGWGPRVLAWTVAGIFVPPGVALLVLLWPAPRPGHAGHAGQGPTSA